MKLLRLKIQSGFRSLPKGFEMYFLRDFDYGKANAFNPYILAGMNGSGKSNVLEALAEIFYHLDCIYLQNKPDYFDKSTDNKDGFDPKKSKVNAYELEYFTYLDSSIFPEKPEHRAHVKITKTSRTRPLIQWVNELDYRPFKVELSQIEAKSLLPEYVVGYASGNNETLSIPFLKSRLLQYDEYLSDLEAQEFTDPRPESSLVYLDERYSQAILLTNLLMFDKKEGSQNILEPFEKYVQLEDIDSFRLVVYTNKFVEVNLTDQEQNVNISILQNVDPGDTQKSPFTRSYLEKLRRCTTAYFEEKDFEDEEPPLLEDMMTKTYLYLDYKVNEATKEAFRFHFDNDPLKLFEFLQLLLSLDLCELTIKEKQDIYHSSNIFLVEDTHDKLPEKERVLRFKDLRIKKKKLKKTIYTKSLSDGEHQFLHSLGLCLLFRNTRSLFLFDEPETHFNPDWKAKFISSIRNCLPSHSEEGRPIMREMLITTHSPFLISDSRMEYVLFFEKNETTNKVASALRPDFQTFGSSVNKIAIRIFSMPNTIGEFAASKLDEFKKELPKLDQKDELEDLIRRTQKELGESVERTLFVNQVFEKIKSLN
jgi:restriction system-associated AAA family ATPase